MTRHLSTGQRWKIVSLYLDTNLSLRQIAHRLECDISTVKHIIDLYQETNDASERQGRGRKAIIHGPVRRHFRRLMSRSPTNTSLSIATRSESSAGIVVSSRTVRRVRRQENYPPCRNPLNNQCATGCISISICPHT